MEKRVYRRSVDSNAMSPRLAFAIDAAYRAGRGTLAHFNTGTAVEIKADASPVTAADRNAERQIREEIERAFPGDAILGEEEGGDASVPDRWVVDPIDGTKSFIAGVPLYGTLLSYEVDRTPILGVCYLPGLDELLWAERGSGAFLNGRPIRVSERATLDGATACIGSHRGLMETGRWEGVTRIIDRAMAVRTWGDAFGYALVASGRADCMLDPAVSRWDLSAFAVIIPEAGGRFTDFDGGVPFARGDRKLGCVASSAAVHAEVLAQFGGTAE